jgi:glycosyltransferase involved in cell wall biosynthesis
LREGTPNALLEAMACRVPCLISSIPENIELIQNPEQHFPPDQPEILAEKINNLMENQEYYDELLNTTLADKQRFVFDWGKEMVKVAEEAMSLKY